jgi:hypothetical protein
MSTTRISTILCVTVLICFGCGQTDLNKDLKPIPADAKPPKMAKDGARGANPEDKPAPLLK